MADIEDLAGDLGAALSELACAAGTSMRSLEPVPGTSRVADIGPVGKVVGRAVERTAKQRMAPGRR